MWDNRRSARKILVFVALVIVFGSSLASAFAAEEPGKLRPEFGAAMEDLRSRVARIGLDDSYPIKAGIVTWFVLGDSVADQAGLEPYDIIVEVEGIPMKTPGDLRDWLESTKHGETYRMTVWRQGEASWVKKIIKYRSVWSANAKPIMPGCKWDGPLAARMSEPIIYIAGGRPTLRDNFMAIQFDGKPPIEGLFDVDGTPQRYSVSSSDETSLTIENAAAIRKRIEQLESETEDGRSEQLRRLHIKVLEDTLKMQNRLGGESYTFLKPGNVSIRVAVGEYEIQHSVEVVEIPVALGDTGQKVIETLGLPRHKNSFVVSWPKTEIHDGLLYRPTASERLIEVVHWRYDAYPGLVLSVRDGLLQRINTDSRGMPEEAQKPRVLLNKAAGDSSKNAISRSEGTGERTRAEKTRSWTDTSGKFSVVAEYSGMIDTRVLLRKNDGEIVRVPFDRLSEADQRWINERRKKK